MHRRAIRVAVAIGACGLLMGVLPNGADAQVAINVVVSGNAVCGTAGPVGRYTLNWTVTNNSSVAVQVTSAVESGAFTGNVTFTPNPIPASTAATGSDGPVGGTVSGTVTLTVDVSVVGGQTAQATGTIQLAGNCVIPATTTTTTVAPTSTSTTQTTARAVVVSPRFTG